MRKTKISAKSASTEAIEPGNPEEISTIQTVKEPSQSIRILFQGTCTKLTARGRGDLSYELGIDEAAGASYVRISANVSSGGFSNEWLALNQIRTLLESNAEQKKSFSTVSMEGLFRRRSANNYGYLAAILKAEGVLVVLPGKPVMLNLGDWEPVLQKIKVLQDTGVNLTDHIAITAKERADKRAQLMVSMQASKKAKAENSLKDEPSDQVSEEPDKEAPDTELQEN